MKITLIILAILIVAFFAVSLSPEDHSARPSLPPRFVVGTEQEARRLAGEHIVAVFGTGSMEPYIPANADPEAIVAIAAVECPPYEYLRKGDLVIYRWNNGFVMHQIIARQGRSWIASGLANPYYDGPRVNRETYHSRVVRVYVISPSASSVTARAR